MSQPQFSKLSLTALAIVLSLAGSLVFAAGIGCPKETRLNGESTPDVSEAWCEVAHDRVKVLHGPYRAWWPNGKLGNAGQYHFGRAVGKWTAWHPNGKLQGEEWFADGVIVKARFFNEAGKEVPQPAKSNSSSNPTPTGAAGLPR